MQIKDVQDFLHPQEDEKTSQVDAHFIVLPFPLEKTTSYVSGTAKGPQAILDASSQIEYFDPEIQVQALDKGIYTDHRLHDLAINKEDTKTVLDRASGIVKEYIEQDRFVLTLGGEHTITPGVATPFLDKYKDQITVVHIDAHADLKDEYEGSKYSHACAIRRIVKASPIVSVGIRSVDQEEFQFAKDNPLITTIYSHQMAENPNWVGEAIAAVQTPYVYVTVDVDGLDPSIMPATGTPQPGGLSWFEICKLIKGVASIAKIVGADVNELCPLPNHHASDFVAAKLCYKILGYSLIQKS